MRRSAGLTALAIVLAALPVAALAQGPFGIGAPEPSGAAWAGPLAPLFDEIAALQTSFYRQLTDAIGSMREDGSAFWLLAGVSFLYGIFHAAGPGHGKAVITAYLLASGETLKRGVVIAFAAAFVQALVAVALVAVLAGILQVTATSMTDATRALEIGSYLMIVAIGLWLLWTRIRGHGHHHHAHAHDHAAHDGDHHAHDHASHQHAHHDHVHDDDGADQTSNSAAPHPALNFAAMHAGPSAIGLAVPEAAGRPHHHDHDDHGHSETHDRDHDHEGHDHSHAPDPELLRQPLTLRSAWAAIVAVGLRPCSGAIIVLVFALAQGLFAAGIASTFVMAVGTAITVSLLATLAVLARDLALRLTGGGRSVTTILRVIEIAAAAAVLALGLLLLGGALSV